MKYVANPVVVDAFVIKSVTNEYLPQGLKLVLDNGEEVMATREMISRMTPVPGDYWVIQADNYIYLNPKEVFERKYSSMKQEAANASQ